MLNTSQLIENISLKGYQIVDTKMFHRITIPTMNIFPDSIAFNKDCHSALNNCDCVQVMVNTETQTVLIRPCPSSEENSLLWERGTKDTYIPRFSCEDLTRTLFSVWKWDTKYHYRASGRLVKADNKLMLLFDFKDYEIYEGSKRIPRK